MYWLMSFFDIIFKISTALGGSTALMTLKAASRKTTKGHGHG